MCQTVVGVLNRTIVSGRSRGQESGGVLGRAPLLWLTATFLLPCHVAERALLSVCMRTPPGARHEGPVLATSSPFKYHHPGSQGCARGLQGLTNIQSLAPPGSCLSASKTPIAQTAFVSAGDGTRQVRTGELGEPRERPEARCAWM